MKKIIKIKIISLGLTLSILGGSYTLIKNINKKTTEKFNNNPTYEDYLNDNEIINNQGIYYIVNPNEDTKIPSQSFKDEETASKYISDTAKKEIIHNTGEYLEDKLKVDLFIPLVALFLSGTTMISAEAFIEQEKETQKYINPVIKKRKARLEVLLDDNFLDESFLSANEIAYVNTARKLPKDDFYPIIDTLPKKNYASIITNLSEQYHVSYNEILARIIELKSIRPYLPEKSQNKTKILTK